MTSRLDKQIERLSELSAQADSKRTELRALLDLTREQTRPANLAKEAGNHLLDKGLDIVAKGRATARANPLMAIGAAMAAGAVLSRKPLFKLSKAAYDAVRHYIEELSCDQSVGDSSEGKENG